MNVRTIRSRSTAVLALVAALQSSSCTAATTDATGTIGGNADDRSPTSIAVSAGNGQSVQTLNAVATNPGVLVKDGSGRPVSGVTVNFTVDTGGGSITGAHPVTNALGTAFVGGWTLGPQPGVNRLKATVSDLPGKSATFTATA